MRTNQDDSAEYYAKTYGTRSGSKTTERQTKTHLGTEKTGDGSVREVEEFIFHPNIFKQEIGIGEAVMIVPLNKGTKAVRLKLDMLEDIDSLEIPIVAKPEPRMFEIEFPKFKNDELKKDRFLENNSKDDLTKAVNQGRNI